MSKKKPILVIAAEPFSIFSEILFKTFKKYKLKKPLVIIASFRLIKSQMKYLKYKIPLNKIDKNFEIKDLKIKALNIINLDFAFSKPFKKISKMSNLYNASSFQLALDIIKSNNFVGLINGPISKKFFLKNNVPGITEYIAKKTKTQKFAMLIYNKKLAVSPITTHIPINKVSKVISKKKIIDHVELINKFYKKNFNQKPRIAITGLNPHCENNLKNNEEKRIIIPAIKYFKRKSLKITGPLSADSLFMRENIKKFDVVIGMYHDQVLIPIKTIHNFNAINITLGLPFIRITPDHGPNENMRGKNKSSPESLISAIKFLENR